VHRIPFDVEKPDAFRGRLNDEMYKLDFESVPLEHKPTTVTCAKLFEGNLAFVATDRGLLRWQFLMQWKSDDDKWTETVDCLKIENPKQQQLDCVMSEKDAIFYKWHTQEFQVVNLANFETTKLV
jgi:hypothetical protein